MTLFRYNYGVPIIISTCYYRDVPTPISEVRTGDFNGDGVVDILTLHSEVEVHHCYTPTLHLCEVTDDRVAVKSKWVYTRRKSGTCTLYSHSVLQIKVQLRTLICRT